MSTTAVMTLKPDQILADMNIRYGLKKERIASMAESIKERGGVMESIEVEPLNPPIDGKKYRVTDGHYRHAAATLLNETENAGVTLNATLVSPTTPVDRLKRQLTANLEREDMSPMDKARAIREAQELNIPTPEIREMFATPGGKKGIAKQPASNSFINMMASFLDLPKSVQAKIHVGLIGVAAAYELTKLSKNEALSKDEIKAKQEEIIADCEADRQKELERAEKDEEKFLKGQAKTQAQLEKEAKDLEKAAKDKEVLELSKAVLEKAKVDAEEKTKLALKLYQEKVAAATADAESKKKAEEAHKAADADLKAATAKFRGAQNDYTKLSAKYSTEPKKKEAKSNTKPDIPKAKPVDPAKVKAAVAKVNSNYVALNAAQMRKVAEELTLPGHPKVKAIGEALLKCFSGITTTQQCYTSIAEATGEATKKAVKTA